MSDADFSDIELEIDMRRLPEQWAGQPRQYRKAADAWAEANRRERETENALKVIRAEVRSKIRSNPEVYGIPEKKATVDAIDDAMTRDKRYQQALVAHHHALYELDLMTGLRDSKRQMKDGLHDCVLMLLSDLRAEPRLTDEDNKMLGRMADDVEVRKTRAMQRRREELA